MIHQLKAGDLAVVVGCVSDPVDIGKVVELWEFIDAGDVYFVNGNFFHSLAGRCAWVCLLDGPDGHSLIAPEHLMPLRGDFAPEQTKSREVSA